MRTPMPGRVVAAFLLIAAHNAAAQGSVLTLSQIVDRALASHPSIATSQALRDRAAADVADARAALKPRLAADATFNQFEEPTIVKPLHGFNPQNPPLFDRSLVQAGISGSWTLYDFGLRAARVHAQEALVDAATAAIGTAESQLIARVSAAYIRVLTQRDVLAAHDQRITSLTAEQNRIRQLAQEGKAARVEQLRVDAELLRARADRIAAVGQREVAEQELAQFSGVAGDSVQRAALGPLALPAAVIEAATGAQGRADVVARAMQSSAEVRELEQRVRAARAAAAAARATSMPEVRLSGAYVDRGRLRGDFSAEWQMGMAVSVPVYTGGIRQNAEARATADERLATAQLRLARMNVELAIDRVLASLRDAHARTVALESAVEQSAEVARIERLALDVGSGTQTDFLNAEANLLRTRSTLIETQHAEISAYVELARLSGDLTREWLVKTIERAQ